MCIYKHTHTHTDTQYIVATIEGTGSGKQTYNFCMLYIFFKNALIIFIILNSNKNHI